MPTSSTPMAQSLLPKDTSNYIMQTPLRQRPKPNPRLPQKGKAVGLSAAAGVGRAAVSSKLLLLRTSFPSDWPLLEPKGTKPVPHRCEPAFPASCFSSYSRCDRYLSPSSCSCASLSLANPEVRAVYLSLVSPAVYVLLIFGCSSTNLRGTHKHPSSSFRLLRLFLLVFFFSLFKLFRSGCCILGGPSPRGLGES